jgi:hypothetical protein
MKYNGTTIYAVGLNNKNNKNNCTEAVPISGITASNSQPKHPASYAIDNSSTTRWANDGKGSWIQLDLGSVQNVCSVDTSWFMQNPRVYNFVLAASTDGINFPNKIENKSNGTALGPEKYYMNNTKARIIRITINGNSENNYASMSDIKVYHAFNQPSTQMNNDRNASASTVTETKYETDPSISVGTDDSKYSQGEQVTILGRVHNGTGYSSETLKLTINKTHYEYLGVYLIQNTSIPITSVTLLTDSFGRFNYNISLQEAGKYLVSASTNLNGKSIESTTTFEVENIFFSNTFIMIYMAIFFLLLLLAVIWHANNKFGNLSDPVQFRINQNQIANVELLRFLCFSGVAAFTILSLIFADSEIGVNSPIGLVKQNFVALNETQMQTVGQNGKSAWVINVGGAQNDNYGGGIQVPTYVIVFGLAGGYLRYLYGMRYFFSRLTKDDKFEHTDSQWGDLNITDNFSFIRHSLRSLSLFFLSPLIAVAVWFILFQGGTTGKWAIAAISFSLGLITEEVIQVIIGFVRKMLGGIKEDAVSEKKDSKIKVLTKIPADGSSGVSVFTDVLASFEVPVDKETVSRGFKLFVEADNKKEEVPGGITQGENNLTYRFVPSRRQLEPDRTYIASIEGVIDLVGRACETVAWLFSTRVKPRVLHIHLGPQNSTIIVEFSEPVDEQSVEENFVVTVKDTNTRVDGEIKVDGKRANFTPKSPLNKGTVYRVELTKKIKDKADNELAYGKDWEFKA